MSALRLAIPWMLLGVTLLAACGGGDGAGGSKTVNNEVKATYDVKYTANARVIEQKTLERDLAGVSDDGSEYRFKGPDATKGLQSGQIVIMEGKALRKVTGVEQRNGETVVRTEEAKLAEAVKDGTIRWEKGVNWGSVPKESFNAPIGGSAGGLFARTQLPGGVKFTGLIQGWQVDVTLSPSPERLNIDLSASRAADGGTGDEKLAAVSGKGWVSNFTEETLLTFENSTVTKMTSKTVGLEGEMELKWAALKQGQVGLTQPVAFRIPVELPITFFVGPVPVTLKVMAALRVVPELSVDKASSGGSWKVHYRSDQGFQFANNLQSPFDSHLHSADMDTSGPTVSAGMGVVGFGLGVEFPRIELSLFGQTAMAFITINTYSTSFFNPGTTFTADVKPCQKGSTTLSAIAGYKLSVLGSETASWQDTLWQQEYSKYKDGDKC